MFIMLTNKNFLKGESLLNISKYNINYDKRPLYDIVLANLAYKLLNQPYVTLTDKERNLLENIINK